MTVETRRRSRRLEVRTTEEERSIIDAAVAAGETDLTSFVVGSLLVEARRVLADRTRFTLSAEALKAWEDLNVAPARSLPGVLALMSRPSPFGK
ncbi:MAG TPA: DUF1778 domain-containing protein [Trebonia sp.]|jgi:uncharacterized protein (DUF1778 family)